MYIRGLNPRKSTELAEAVPFVLRFYYFEVLYHSTYCHWYTVQRHAGGLMVDRRCNGSVCRVIYLGSRGRYFETHRIHCAVALSKTFYRLLITGSTKEDRKAFRHD